MIQKSFAATLCASALMCLVACDRQSSVDAAPVESSAASSSEVGDVEALPLVQPEEKPTVEALESARQRVSMLTLDPMLKQETAVEAAYARGDIAGLEAAASSLMLGAPDAGNWKGNQFDPYLRCDTAWRDLGLYASAMRHELDESKPTTRKILEQERADFARTKKACQEFLAMKPAEAWEKEEASFAK